MLNYSLYSIVVFGIEGVYYKGLSLSWFVFTFETILQYYTLQLLLKPDKFCLVITILKVLEFACCVQKQYAHVP